MVVASKTDHPFTFLHHLKVDIFAVFAVIARIFDDQKSEKLWTIFFFFLLFVHGVKPAGQKLFLRLGRQKCLLSHVLRTVAPQGPDVPL